MTASINLIVSGVSEGAGVMPSIVTASRDIIASGVNNNTETFVCEVTASLGLIESCRFIFSHLTGITECEVTAGRGATSGAFVWIKIALGSAILSSDW